MPSDKRRFPSVCPDCGAETMKRIDVLNTRCRPCGIKAAAAKRAHGGNVAGKKTRLYAVWCNMRQRCRDKNSKFYKNYGGRGITIYEEWDDFPTFRDWALEAGYADDMTIDRIDNDGNYHPDNCRWITKSENSRDAATRRHASA